MKRKPKPWERNQLFKRKEKRVSNQQTDYLTDEEKSALCLQCQKCCKVLPISLRYEPESAMFKTISTFFIEHGCDAMVIGNTFVISVQHVCQHLTEEGCSIYEKRPEVCRNYDGRKDPRLARECLWSKRAGMTSAAGYSDRAEVKLT